MLTLMSKYWTILNCFCLFTYFICWLDWLVYVWTHTNTGTTCKLHAERPRQTQKVRTQDLLAVRKQANHPTLCWAQIYTLLMYLFYMIYFILLYFYAPTLAGRVLCLELWVFEFVQNVWIICGVRWVRGTHVLCFKEKNNLKNCLKSCKHCSVIWISRLKSCTI